MTLSDDDIVSVLQSEDKMKQYLALFDSDPSKIDHRIWMIHFRVPKKKRMDVLNSFFQRELAKKKILFSFMPPEMLLARVYKTLKIPYKLNWGSENSSIANEKKQNGSLKKFLKYYNCFPKKESKKSAKNDPYTFDESILEPIMLYSEFRKRWSAKDVPKDTQCRDNFQPPATSTPKLPLIFGGINRGTMSRKSGRKKIASQQPARRVLPTVGKSLASLMLEKPASRKPTRQSTRSPEDFGKPYIFTKSNINQGIRSNSGQPTFLVSSPDRVSTRRSKSARALFVADDENTLSDHGRSEDERSWTKRLSPRGSPTIRSPSPCRMVPQTTIVTSPVISSPQKRSTLSNKEDKSRKITISSEFLEQVSPLPLQTNVNASAVSSENIGSSRVHSDTCSSLNAGPVEIMDVEMESPKSPQVVITEKSYRESRIADQNSTSEESTPVSASNNLSRSPSPFQVVTPEKSHRSPRIANQDSTSGESTPALTSRNLSRTPTAPQVVSTEKSSHRGPSITDQNSTFEESTPVLSSRNLSPASPQVVTTRKSSDQGHRIADQKLTSEESTPVLASRNSSQSPTSSQLVTAERSPQGRRIADENSTSSKSIPVSILRKSLQSPSIISDSLVEKSTPVKESCILGQIPLTPSTSHQNYSIDQNSTSEKSTPARGSRIPEGPISTPDKSDPEVLRCSNSSVESSAFDFSSHSKNTSYELLRPPLDISFGKAARNLDNVVQHEVEEEPHQVPSNLEYMNRDDEEPEDRFCEKSNPDVVPKDASILPEQVVPEVFSDPDEILVVPNSSTEYSSESGKQERRVSSENDEIFKTPEKNSEYTPQTDGLSNKSPLLNDHVSKMEEVFNFGSKIRKKSILTTKSKSSNSFTLEVDNDAVAPDSELKSQNHGGKTSRQVRKKNSLNTCDKKISKVPNSNAEKEIKLSAKVPTSEYLESPGNRPIVEVENDAPGESSNGSVLNSCVGQSLEPTSQNSSETLDEQSGKLDTNNLSNTPASPFRRLLRPRKGREMDTIPNTDVKDKTRVGASAEVPKKNVKASPSTPLSRRAVFEKLVDEMKRKAQKTSTGNKTSKRVVTRKSSSLSGNVSSQLSVQDESDDTSVFRKPTSKSASQPVQKQGTKPTARKISPNKKMKTLVDYVGYKVGKKASVVGRKKNITTFSDVSEVESQSPPRPLIKDQPSSSKTVEDSDSSVGVTQRSFKRPVRKLFTQLTSAGEIRVPGRRGRRPKYLTSSDSESLWSDQAGSEKSYAESIPMGLDSVADKFNSLKLDAIRKTITNINQEKSGSSKSALSPSPPLFVNSGDSSEPKSKTPPSKVSVVPINLREDGPSSTSRPPLMRPPRLSISPSSESNATKNCELMQFETPTFLKPSSESAKNLSGRKKPDVRTKSSKLPRHSQTYLSSPDVDMVDHRKLTSKKYPKRLGKLPNLSISPSSDSSVEDVRQELSPSKEKLQSFTSKLPTTPLSKTTIVNKNRKSLLLEMSSLSESLPGLDGSASTTVTPLPSDANSIYSGGENVNRVLNFGRPLPRIDEEADFRLDSPSTAYSKEDKLHHVNKYMRQNRKMLSPYAVDTSEKESDISPEDFRKRRSLPKIAKTRKQRNLWYRFDQDSSDSSSTDSFFQHRKQSTLTPRESTTTMPAERKNSELVSSPFLSDEDDFQLRENAINAASDRSGDALRRRLRLFSEDEYDSEDLAIMLGKSFPRQIVTVENSTEAEKQEKTFQAEETVNDLEDVNKLFEAVESKQRKKQNKSFQLPTPPQNSNSVTSYQEAMWNSFPSTEETARIPAEEKLRETREKLRGMFARHSYENNTDSLDLLQLLESSAEASHHASDEKMNSDLSDIDFL